MRDILSNLSTFQDLNGINLFYRLMVFNINFFVSFLENALKVEWWLVCDDHGQIGYVPGNYLQEHIGR